MSDQELLEAIKAGKASRSYNYDKKADSYTWKVAVGVDVIPDGNDQLMRLVRSGHEIRQRMTTHLNFGDAGGAGTYELFVKEPA